MIRISAIYRNGPGSRFDAAYYVERHTPMAIALLGPSGLRAVTTTLGEAALEGGAPPYWAVSELVFDTRDAFDSAMAANGPALFADIPNYTDVIPELFVSGAAISTGVTT